jgi:hypothetical protein
VTQKGGFSLDPANVTSTQAERIHAQVNQFLDDPAMSDHAQLDAMSALLNEVLPAPEAPPQPRIALPEPPVADWARDDHSPPSPSLNGTPNPTASWSPSTTTDGGGGRVEKLFDLSALADDDESVDEQFEDRYALWRPPTRQPVVVPDNVADVAPVDTDTDPGSAPPTDPIPAQPPADQTRQHPPPRALAAALATRWKAMPGWARIATPAAAGMVAALVVALLLTGHSDPAPIDGPPPTAEALPSAPGAPKPAPLMPASVEQQCPAGSSANPGLVFGSDKSEAWICTRIFNVENSVLTITFNQPMVVCAIKVVPGFNYVEKNGEDHWNEHRLVTQILWRFPSQIVQKINPTRGGATLTLQHCIATQVITANIQKTERPPAIPNKGGGPLTGIIGGPDEAKVDGSFAIGHLEILGYPA